MKKQYSKILMTLVATAFFQTGFAQAEFYLAPEWGTRFNDVNNSGLGISGGGYFNLETQEWSTLESGATSSNALNDNGDVAGSMFFDEPNFILQPAFKKDGVWNAIGWIDDADPAESSFTTYGISPNGKWVVGQISRGCCVFGSFKYNTETEELFAIFSEEYIITAYDVNDEGIVVGWADDEAFGSTRRLPAYFTTAEDVTIIQDDNQEFAGSSVNDINGFNIMVGEYMGAPFIFDQNTDTFTTYTIPAEWEIATFTGISDTGVAVGYVQRFGVDGIERDAIIYHPSLGEQPIFIKDVLTSMGVSFETLDGLLGTSIAISSNGNYIVGWVNGPPVFAEGWMINFDDLLLDTPQNETLQVTYYPNPVQDVLHIKSPEVIETVSVLNVTGQQVFEKEWNTFSGELNLSALNSGVYFVRATANNSAKTFKIVKK